MTNLATVARSTNSIKMDDMESSDMKENEKNSEEIRNKVKVICLGDSAVGKSKLVERFLLDGYKPLTSSTYAVQLYKHQTEIEGTPVNVQIWDTAGQEMFESLHPSYYHHSHAAILVFDGTRKVTYRNLTKWYQELRENRPDIPVLCAANKIDANSEVTQKSFAFPQKNGLPLYYVSASDGTNVVKLFKDAITQGWRYKEKGLTLEDNILDELENLTD